MRYFSIGLIIIQILLFLIGGVLILKLLSPPLGGFDGRFFNAQFIRFIASVAPYFVLLISVPTSILLHRRNRYLLSILNPFILIFVAFIFGQSILKIIPDPIQENFGARSEPYAGFLVLPKDAIPEGFKEVEHQYTKRHYSVRFQNDRNVQFGISEDDSARFGDSSYKPIQEFEYRGVQGHIYHYKPEDKERESLSLIWLNPPKQRVYMWVSEYPLSDEYSPEFLINILKNMVVQQ